MSEHRLPRDPQPQPQEAFVAHEAATGKSFAIRECTDAQLAAHLAEASTQHGVAVQQAIQAIRQSEALAKAVAVITYEIDRRSRTFSIVGDLSQVHGLRRQ
jgi:hypothetical protein